MKKIKLSNGNFTFVDDDDYDYLVHWNWQCSRNGYAMREVSKGPLANRIRKTVWMHRVINKTPSHLLTDHKNQNKLDNRKRNLRNSTHAQNMTNRILWKSSSGHRGVTWYKPRQKWMAQIQVNKKHMNLGLFDDPNKASEAYQKAAKQYHGEFACQK